MNLRLGDNIRRLRRERYWTQEKLAEFLGVSVGAVYKWERGKSVPELSLLLEMATLFSVSTDVLLGYVLDSPGIDQLLETIEEHVTANETAEAISGRGGGASPLPEPFSARLADGDALL